MNALTQGGGGPGRSDTSVQDQGLSLTNRENTSVSAPRRPSGCNQPFGLEYRVRDGKRPAWLDDDDVVEICQDGEWFGLGVGVLAYLWHWHKGVTALRLQDPNHWANAPIAAGLEPWAGGDAPPADFKPGGLVMFRDGDVLVLRQPKNVRWCHNHRVGDLIGYERTEEHPLAELQRLGQEAEAVLASAPYAHADGSRECRSVVNDCSQPVAGDPIEQVIVTAVRAAIEQIGLEAFKQTSFFGSAQKAKFKPGDSVIYQIEDGYPLRLKAKIIENIEGWWKIELGDGTKATVRPSRIIHPSTALEVFDD